MELNLAPIDASKPPIRATQRSPKPVKGNWKKRRQVQVIQRAQAERRANRFKGKQSNASQLAQDEFQSGIDKNQDSTSAEKPQESSSRPSKRRRVPTSDLGASVQHPTAEKSSASIPGNSLRKKDDFHRNTNSTFHNSLVRADQTPQAVSATLAAIGNASAGKAAFKSEKKNASNSQTENDIKPVEGESDESPKTFAETGLYRSICHHVSERMNLSSPTTIQEKVLKAFLNLEDGKQFVDLLVRSPTGSGKTFAYLFPIAHYLLNRTRRITREDGSLAIVVVPTRELAEQVADVAIQLFRPWHWIVVGSVIGGESKKREKARLRKGISVLIATPGRLLDHMRNTLSFSYRFCEFFVLDEADRLLDLGFESEIKEVVENLDNQASISHPGADRFRSNVLLSATLRKDVEKLAEFSLQDPLEITASASSDSSGAKFSMPLELRQHFCIVEQRFRLVTLACFLRLRALKDVRNGNFNVSDAEALPSCKVIVFFSTCDSVDFHYDLFKAAQLPSELFRKGTSKDRSEPLVPLDILRIHGNHTQADRMAALRGFRKSNRAVLLCTDVAARGLDLKGLTFAIQYDPPTGGQGEELEYLHRAGRTARMGARGDALLFLLPSEKAYVGKLESKGVEIAEISGSAALAALDPRADLSHSSSISYATRLVTSAVQEMFDQAMNADANLKKAAVAGFQAYCRAYATHAKEVRYFFHVKNLHLGHVARAFALSDKPIEFAEMMTEIKKAKADAENDEGGVATEAKETKSKADVARAIAEGEAQPFNTQSSSLARRRREKGRGQESFKEMALEFGA